MNTEFSKITKRKASKVSSVWREALGNAPHGKDPFVYANLYVRRYFSKTVSPENLDKLILSFNRNAYSKFNTAYQQIMTMWNGEAPADVKQAFAIVKIIYASTGNLPS